MFRVYFTNYDRYADVEFQNVFNAINFGKTSKIQFRVEKEADTVWDSEEGSKFPTELTTYETAFLLGLSRVRIIQLCQDEWFGRKFGTSWMITFNELEEFSKIERPVGIATKEK